MNGRRSYSGLMAQPAFGLYARDGSLVATVRAPHAVDARELFRSMLPEPDVKRGDRVRLVDVR